MFKKFKNNNKNKLIYLILVSLIFSILFSLNYINLSLLNFSSQNLLNYPSVTSVNSDFTNNDIDMTFSVARRSYERFSIFELGSNIYEIKNSYHHYASRGFGIFITGFFLNFTNVNIYVICMNYLLFSFINFLLISYFFREYELNKVIFFSILSILFGSIIFGGVINPLHYFQYLKEILDFKGFRINPLVLHTALDRIPNILINNVFIFINFILLRSFFLNPNKKLFNIIFICLFLTSFVDGIIFIIFLFFTFIIIFFNFLKKKIDNKYFIYLLFLILILSSTIIFHIYNYKLIISSGNEKHGLNLSDFWKGNPRYALEIISFPIILHFIFLKELNYKFKFELFFFFIVLFFYLFFFLFINEVLASRISHRNFEILLAAISYKYIYEIFKNNYFNCKKNYIFLFFILHIIYILLDLHFNLIIFFQYLFFIFFLFIFLIKKSKFFFLSRNLFVIFFIIFFFISLYLNYGTRKNIIEINEVNQKKFFNWLNSQDIKTLISLNFGVLLNSELQGKSNVYITLITNAPESVNRSILQKRLNDIFYLYGFTLGDLSAFLVDYNTKWELRNLKYSFHKDNLSLLNKIIFYENFQINYDKKIPIKILLESYESYLSNQKYKDINFFDTCIISEYDKKFIKKNSFFYFLNDATPIYKNNYLSVYNCIINN